MPASGNSAVDKALDLVEAVARSGRPLRLSEIADPLGLQRPTAHRVLADLVRRGWVMRIGDRYLPGTVVLQLSRATAAHSLVGIARPVLERLSAATATMVNLQVPEEDRSRVVDVVRPARLEMISDLRDELLPVHRFAGPLALVAAMDERTRAPTWRRPPPRAIPWRAPTACSPTWTVRPAPAGACRSAALSGWWRPSAAPSSPRTAGRCAR